MDRPQLNLNPSIVLRRMYVYKEEEDEDEKKYYVMAEQDNGRRRFVIKYKLRDDAIRFLRDYARRENWRVQGEEIFKPQGKSNF
jgi:hypothetical protein